jgi:hypothetical protein
MNVLDPDVKKGIWTEDEMKILRDSQKELGNKWSDIAKRIPGRSKNSVKNRWYNQKTVRETCCFEMKYIQQIELAPHQFSQSDRRAQKKRELASTEPSEQEQNAIEQHDSTLPNNVHHQVKQSELCENESEEDLQFL